MFNRQSLTLGDPTLEGRTWTMFLSSLLMGSVRFHILLLGAVAMILATPLAGAAQGRGLGNSDFGVLRPRTVIVTPFINVSGERADDWIGAGIVETVRADLDRFESLSVIDSEGLTGFSNLSNQTVAVPALDDEALARFRALRLGVSWIVGGGFQRVGDQLRITARIVNVQTGTTSATVKVDGQIDDIFALQDRIVKELSSSFASIAVERPETTASATDATVVDRRPPADASTAPAQIAGRTQSPETEQPIADQIRTADVTGSLTIGPGSDGGRSGGIPAVGGAANAAGILTGRPTIGAPRIADGPRIDGRLDDPVWQTAGRITEFVQQRPLNGSPATEQTDVYVAYDSSNVYFGLHAHYSDVGLIRANLVDRDQTGLDDRITIYLDTFLDQQRAFLFSVNGYGVQGDAIVSSGDQGASGGRGMGGGGQGPGGPGAGPTGAVAPGGDQSWDVLFSSAGNLVEDGWTAEIAIPFKSLRYPQKAANEAHRWGLQIVRTIEGKDESDVWAPISRDVAGFLPQMGVLEGMTGLSLSRNLEIMPSVTAIQSGSRQTTTGQFINDNTATGGANIKYGITSNLTLDFTYNPDFSQIETDRPQIEVNQRFSLFFPELRPFFLEGQEIFEIAGPPYLRHVQTRTIRDPQYGAKLTGKIGRTSIGLLVANDEAPGKIEDHNDPLFGKSAQVMLARVRYDLYSESHLGVLFTDRELLGSHSRLAVIDGSLRLGPTHKWGFQITGTKHRDLSGVERTGYKIDTSIRRQARRLSYFLAHYDINPNFRTDLGFITRADAHNTTGNVSYRFWPESWVVNWGPRFTYRRLHDFDGVLQDQQTGVAVDAQFSRNIRVNAGVNRDLERFRKIDFWKTRYTFGGGIMTSRRVSFMARINTGDEIFFVDNPFLGSGTDLALSMTLRPSSRLQSDVSLDTRRFIDVRGDADENILDVKIWRTFTTYQFTRRLVLRNIMEYNSFDRRLLTNILATYRVNAGTVFFVGYDARYDQGNRFDEQRFPNTSLLRTNHAIFTKLQYLFRF